VRLHCNNADQAGNLGNQIESKQPFLFTMIHVAVGLATWLMVLNSTLV